VTFLVCVREEDSSFKFISLFYSIREQALSAKERYGKWPRVLLLLNPYTTRRGVYENLRTCLETISMLTTYEFLNGLSMSKLKNMSNVPAELSQEGIDKAVAVLESEDTLLKLALRPATYPEEFADPLVTRHLHPAWLKLEETVAKVAPNILWHAVGRVPDHRQDKVYTDLNEWTRETVDPAAQALILLAAADTEVRDGGRRR